MVTEGVDAGLGYGLGFAVGSRMPLLHLSSAIRVKFLRSVLPREVRAKGRTGSSVALSQGWPQEGNNEFALFCRELESAAETKETGFRLRIYEIFSDFDG